MILQNLSVTYYCGEYMLGRKFLYQYLGVPEFLRW